MKYISLAILVFLSIAGEIPALNLYKEQEISRKEKIVLAKTETFFSKITRTITFTPTPKGSATRTPVAVGSATATPVPK